MLETLEIIAGILFLAFLIFLNIGVYVLQKDRYQWRQEDNDFGVTTTPKHYYHR